MAAKIHIEVSGHPQGNPGDPVVHPYSVIESSAPTVYLSLTDDTGVTQYFWSFLSKPVGSIATMQNATTSNASFTPDVALAGSYLIKCSINNGATVVTNGLGFTTQVLEVRIPSAHETGEFNSLIGWDETMQDFMRKVDAQILAAGDSYWDRFDGSGSGGVGYYLMPKLSERISIPAGTKAAPSIVFSGDIDTGFWSPSAGTISTAIGNTPGIQIRRNGAELYLETYDVDDSNYKLTVLHHKEGSESPALFTVRASGTDSNDGSTLRLESVGGPTSGMATLEINAVDGSECIVDINAISNSDTITNLDLTSSTGGTPNLNILCESTGPGWATMRLACESSGYGASLVLGCKGAPGASDDEGRIQIGEYDTGKIAFLSSDIYASASWTGDYVYLIEDSAELEAYFAAYGEVSIIEAIVAAGSSGGFWQRSGTVLSPLTAGDTVRVGAGSATDVGIGFEGTNNTGMYQKSATEIGLAINGSTDSFFGRSEIGGTYGDRPSFMGEEPIGLVSYSNDSTNLGAGDLYVAALRQAASPSTPGAANLWIEAVNDNTLGTGSFVTVLAKAIETDALVDISAHISGDTEPNVLAEVDIHAYNSSTDQYTNAVVALYAEAEGGGIGLVLIGNDVTDDVGFSDAYFAAASLGWSKDYLRLSAGVNQWEEFGIYFGATESSIIFGINSAYKESLYVPTAESPLESSLGGLVIEANEGNVFDVSVTESITSIDFFGMHGPYGNLYYGRRIKIRFVFTGSYTISLSGITGGRFASGVSDISGSNGEVYIMHVDELGSSARYCRIEGPYSS